MLRTLGIMLGLMALSSLVGAQPAWARIISYQGVLYDSTGGTQQSTVSLGFKLYTSASKSADGAEWMAWSESHSGVAVAANGTFSVELGSIVPLPDSIFASELWLEVTVNGQVMSPRTKVGASPYAFVGSRINGDIVTSPGNLRVPGVDSSDYLDLTTTGFNFQSRTDCYTVSPCEWIISNEGDQYTYNCSQSSNYAWSPSGLGVTLYARLHLPLGVDITGLQLYMKDGYVGKDLTLSLYRGFHLPSESPSFEFLGSLTSSGSADSWTLLSTTINHHISDLSNNTYYLKISVPSGVTTGGLQWGMAKVCYSINKFIVRP